MSIDANPATSSVRLESHRATAADYFTLAKPGLTAMSVATAAGGGYLGAGGNPSLSLLLNLTIGTVLVGAGAGTLNQLFERRTDALMRRTERRPFPSGKIAPLTGLLLGMLFAIAGVTHLYHAITPLAGTLALVVLVSYLAAYTPLKRVTHLATAVGGIPGALPPVIGWVSVGRELSIEAYLLFLFLWIWQMPHFLSLAWMYRRDYERGGYRLLPHFDTTGRVTGRLLVLYAAALAPVTIALSVVGVMGWVFLVGSSIAGLLFLGVAYRFSQDITNDRARRVFAGSLLYLSSILLLMLLDRVMLV